jgi:hypothetical protein
MLKVHASHLSLSISKNGWETARVHRYKLDKEDNDDSESVSQNIKHSTRKSGIVKFQANEAENGGRAAREIGLIG